MSPTVAEPPLPLPADVTSAESRRGRRKNKRNLLSTFKKKLVREDSQARTSHWAILSTFKVPLEAGRAYYTESLKKVCPKLREIAARTRDHAT